ncbi:glycosyltransferase [Microvirga sp. 2YAF29]|uniref:glycosyltransferase n=1 Tax=Microvirga sp. 2YAF29 TaxID=3233031 RepID=UPI003F9838B4
MRIVHVITRLLHGGSEENTIASCLHQTRSGHRVMLVHGSEYDPSYYDELTGELELYRVKNLLHPIHPWLDVLSTRELAHLFRSLRADVIHTHQSKAGIVGRAAAALAQVRCIVHGVHIVPFDGVPWLERQVYIQAERMAARVTHGFIHVSHGTAAAYETARIGQNSKHFIVRSGMDVDRYICAERPDDWQEIVKAPVDASRPVVILMLAAFEPRKRHVEFLKGFASAINRGAPITLVLAGDGPCRPDVEREIAALGLGDHVVLTGHHPNPERLIALSDICVLASLREGLPRVVVQYLAGGKPVVVSPIRGIEEIVQPNVNAVVAESESAEAVAQAAVALALDKVRLSALTEGTREARVKDWSFESMFSGLDNAYESLK